MDIKIEEKLISELSALIEQARKNSVKRINSEISLLFWEVGKRINEHILQYKRATYGKEIVVTLSRQLVAKYGRSFEERNLRRMIQFAELFPKNEIVVTLSPQLSWSHFIALLPINDQKARYFYASKIADEAWSVRHTRKQIENKVFERTQLAENKQPVSTIGEIGVFKDPYFFDFLGLKDGYLENDLESAILIELEQIHPRTW